MSSGLAIASFLPSVTSSTAFSTRRLGKSADELSVDPVLAVMYADIASGQISNALQGTTEIAKKTNNAFMNGVVSAKDSIKELSNTNKVLKGIGNVIDFTSRHVNPCIVGASAYKVVASDNKEEAFVREGIALPTMFLFEYAAKEGLGIPIVKKENGKTISIDRAPLYKKNVFLSKQADALKDFCNTKKIFNKSLKSLPSIFKGLGLVVASITGYNLGLNAADKLLENDKHNN